ncbi:MAG: DciA family protein [Gammaproteobacteria bacterium]
MDEKEQPINHWLHHGELGSLLRHLEQLNALNAVIQPLLPAQFKGGCRVENVSGGCLTLAVNNAGLVTLLRYEIPTLLAALRKDPKWAGIASIKCHVSV